jgi:hypothetical protein
MKHVITKPAIAGEKRDRIKSFFVQYASSFRKEDPVYNEHIKLKQNHTARVVREISKLASSLRLNSKQIAFVEVIAWLHDIGRFEQFDTYGTYEDAQSENHAEMAHRVIEEYHLLQDFTREQKLIIQSAIQNHNQKDIPKEESETINFYSRLLRDADKLDIWRVSLETNIFHKIKTETFPAEYIVPYKLVNFFERHQTIPLSEVDTFYDSVLFRLSWVFDLNFNSSLKQFQQRKIADLLLQKLPYSDDLRAIKVCVDRYIREKMNRKE